MRLLQRITKTRTGRFLNGLKATSIQILNGDGMNINRASSALLELVCDKSYQQQYHANIFPQIKNTVFINNRIQSKTSIGRKCYYSVMLGKSEICIMIIRLFGLQLIHFFKLNYTNHKLIKQFYIVSQSYTRQIYVNEIVRLFVFYGVPILYNVLSSHICQVNKWSYLSLQPCSKSFQWQHFVIFVQLNRGGL